MVGRNELHINQATMIEAMQTYLESVFNIAPHVSSVLANGDDDDDFVVVLFGDEEEEMDE